MLIFIDGNINVGVIVIVDEYYSIYVDDFKRK